MDKLYEFIFEETYGKKIGELVEGEAEEIRRAVLELRQSYRSDLCDTEYDKENLRKAYMISYFPSYIWPARRIVEEKVVPLLKDKADRILRLAYFAGGPCPELVGTIMAFSESGVFTGYEVKVLDYEKGWKSQRETTQKVIAKYCGGIRPRLCSISGCDIMLDCSQCTSCRDYCLDEVYSSTDLFFMQNCLNHMLDAKSFAATLRGKLEASKAGSVFVIVDLNYRNVREFMSSIIGCTGDIAELVSTNMDETIGTMDCPVPIPRELKEKIFTGGDGLMAKRKTNYYYIVLQKKQLLING